MVGRLINQVRLKNFRNRPRYKCGHQVPRSHHEAVLIDEREGNRRWQDAEELELKQLFEYDMFKDLALVPLLQKGTRRYHAIWYTMLSGTADTRPVLLLEDTEPILQSNPLIPQSSPYLA